MPSPPSSPPTPSPPLFNLTDLDGISGAQRTDGLMGSWQGVVIAVAPIAALLLLAVGCLLMRKARVGGGKAQTQTVPMRSFETLKDASNVASTSSLHSLPQISNVASTGSLHSTWSTTDSQWRLPRPIAPYEPMALPELLPPPVMPFVPSIAMRPPPTLPPIQDPPLLPVDPAFAQADVNGDGVLDRAEFAAYLKASTPTSLPPPTPLMLVPAVSSNTLQKSASMSSIVRSDLSRTSSTNQIRSFTPHNVHAVGDVVPVEATLSRSESLFSLEIRSPGSKPNLKATNRG